MGDGPSVSVDPQTLANKGAQITPGWPEAPDQAPLAPCGYDLAAAAIERLNHDSARMAKCLAAGKTEGHRLAESFQNAADAYSQVNARTYAALHADPPQPVPIDPVIPKHTAIPRDPVDQTGPPKRAIAADGMTLDESAEAIAQPDHGNSLEPFAKAWRNYADLLEKHADLLTFANVNWEGDAADAAYDKLRALREWMTGVATSCRTLADNADEITSAHREAYAAHPKLGEVKALEARVQAAIQNQSPEAGELFQEWLAWQKLADDIREKYAGRAGALPSINPQWPPDCAPGAASVRTNGDPRQPAGPGANPGPTSGGGSPSGSGGPSPAAPVSPMSAQSPQSTSQQHPAQSGEPSSPSSGGSQGGSPSGGAGGGMPGGIPAAAKTSAHLPTGPSLKPASVGGHGGGAGGGAGGGGPLQPAVTGSAVAPSRGAAAPGAQAGHAGPAAPTGAAGGGGGAPMGGQGGHGQGGKERRRTGNLSPDEELYKEDREWTEGVVGHRTRRDAPDGKDSK